PFLAQHDRLLQPVAGRRRLGPPQGSQPMRPHPATLAGQACFARQLTLPPIEGFAWPVLSIGSASRSFQSASLPERWLAPVEDPVAVSAVPPTSFATYERRAIAGSSEGLAPQPLQSSGWSIRPSRLREALL